MLIPVFVFKNNVALCLLYNMLSHRVYDVHLHKDNVKLVSKVVVYIFSATSNTLKFLLPGLGPRVPRDAG